MARREKPAPAKSNVYTALLVVAMVALVAAIVFTFMARGELMPEDAGLLDIVTPS